MIITTLIFFCQSFSFPANQAWSKLKPTVVAKRSEIWHDPSSWTQPASASLLFWNHLPHLPIQGQVSLMWMEFSSCLNIFLSWWGLSYWFWRLHLWALTSCSFLTYGLHVRNYCKLPSHTQFCICDSDFFICLLQPSRETNQDFQVPSLKPHPCSKFEMYGIFHL